MVRNKKHFVNASNRKIIKGRNIEKTIEKRFNVLVFIVVIIILVLISYLFYFQIVKTDEYKNKLKVLTETYVMGSSAPRGRIYDRNHRLIVDNKPVKVIYYKTPAGISTKEEVLNAYKVARIIDINYKNINDFDLENFWIQNYPDEARAKITDEEWNDLDNRKITLDDIENLKHERITDEDLSVFDELDLEAAYIYYLMNKGYYYDEKIIKDKNVTDEEYALVSEKIDTLKGFNTKLSWEREYPYGNVFRTILGNVSSIPYELKEEYLEKGYELNDIVGTSYLEKQYEEYLKGEKNKYLVLENGSQKLVEEGRRGNDLVLTIDIKLQKAIEEIITQNIIEAKQEPNTEFYNRSFVVIVDPNNGEILAMAGKQMIDGEIYDYTPGVMTSPVAIGSAVKGASHIVGYNTGALEIGEVRDDFCVKIAATPEKCSWTNLGVLNDITALKQSSNSYQYQTAFKVGGATYIRDEALEINEEAFDIYRNVFRQFGLGSLTGIDLPIESLGYVGDSTLSGYLLDFVIGQYDTYTPVQLAQYVATMANGGTRYQLHLLKEVYSSKYESLNRKIFDFKPNILNVVDTKPEYIDRVKQGFRAVLEDNGTGAGYMPLEIDPAGKTGTSQSYVDSDNDGMIDTETLTNTFVGFAPYDNPVMAMAILSPDVTHYENGSTYRTSVNKKISYEVAKKFFEIYK